MRAVADNPTLAAIKGIDADLIAHIVNFVAMGLAGLGGMLLGLDTSIDPLTGFRAMLAIFAAAVVGGLGQHPWRGGRRAGRRQSRRNCRCWCCRPTTARWWGSSRSCWC